MTWKTEISWCVFPDCQNPGTKLMGRNVCLHSGSACCFLYLDKSYNVWADFLFLSIPRTYIIIVICTSICILHTYVILGRLVYLYMDKFYNVWADFLFLSISWTYSSLSYMYFLPYSAYIILGPPFTFIWTNLVKDWHISSSYHESWCW